MYVACPFSIFYFVKFLNLPALGTEQQPFFIALSTDRNSNYPQFIKLRAVTKDDSETVNAFLPQSLVLSKDRTLNTDGKTTFNIMKDRITVIEDVITTLEEKPVSNKLRTYDKSP